MGLLKEIPNDSEANYWITVGCKRRRIKIVSRSIAIYMLIFEENTGLLHFRINEKINSWKLAYQGVVLSDELSNRRVVSICIVVCEVLSRYSCLKIKGLVKKLTGKGQRTSSDPFRNINNLKPSFLWCLVNILILDCID